MKHLKPYQVTLRQVAEHAGVSLSTASLVLNGSTNISAPTSAKVMASIQQLGYVYNRGAANIKAKTPSTFGLILADLANPFYTELLIGIHQELNKLGKPLIVGTTFESHTVQDHLISTMLEHRVGGIMAMLAPDSNNEIIFQFKRLGIPLVLINRKFAEGQYDFIGIDNVTGAHLATEHLIKRGHRRIAFLGGLSSLTTWQGRKQGYINALQEANLDVDNSLILEASPARESGNKLIRKIIDLPDMPTAALCFNDTTAIGAMVELKELGLIPGYDIAIIGFDNILEGSTFTPKLTTVSTHPRLIGANAIRLLQARIDGLDFETQDIILQPELIIRESSSYKTKLTSAGD